MIPMNVGTLQLRNVGAGLVAVMLVGCSPSTANAPPTFGAGYPLPDSSTPTPAVMPTPDLPAGWAVLTSDTMRLTLYHPAGWEASDRDDHHLDLRENGGAGWVEVSIIDGSNSGEWGLSYTPGMEADTLMESLIRAAREDGTFSDPQPIQTRGENGGSISEGFYEVFAETVVIGAIGFEDRAALVVGHAGGDEADAARLTELYRTLVWSIAQN